MASIALRNLHVELLLLLPSIIPDEPRHTDSPPPVPDEVPPAPLTSKKWSGRVEESIQDSATEVPGILQPLASCSTSRSRRTRLWSGKEKTESILEQVQLLLEVARLKDSESGKDDKISLGGGAPEWVKLRVQSRKVKEQNLMEKENEFYDMMVQYGLRHHSYLDVAKYNHKSSWKLLRSRKTPSGKGKICLERIVYHVAPAPHDNELSDTMHCLHIDPELEKLEVPHNLIEPFNAEELMRWPGIKSVFGAFLRTTEEDPHTRVIKHNVRAIAKCYTRIPLTRFTTILDLKSRQVEEMPSRLVVAGTMWARVD
ncbi:hypothetical protein BV25DRAFT_1922781 [Artomyces pyxidatus]|uniref:Uncharacterized protein n=1 Tax=Artomyces pyxidatus TaxID=48021 RepID=A0ACB8SEG9_9AGAM|nr:hypothetical protein BV25DRAFT_1922781 [Artomyces pyxidatus]